MPVSRPPGFAPGPAADRPIDVPRVLSLHYGRQNTACADEKAERGMAATVVGGRAIVIGAGIGGLAAAGAIAGSFEQVTVVERDALPADAADRPGTPQARHIHALLGGGQRALETLFPGFERDLAAAGAVPLRVTADFRTEMPGFDPFPRRDFGWSILSMSRPLIERVARGQVEKHANICLRDRCRALELVLSPDTAAVAGVRCERRGEN
jgi:2-polyprenyl-6-methoxyphenol hydroxylase-like FAD-dependent oxidoreductase